MRLGFGSPARLLACTAPYWIGTARAPAGRLEDGTNERCTSERRLSSVAEGGRVKARSGVCYLLLAVITP